MTQELKAVLPEADEVAKTIMGDIENHLRKPDFLTKEWLVRCIQDSVWFAIETAKSYGVQQGYNRGQAELMRYKFDEESTKKEAKHWHRQDEICEALKEETDYSLQNQAWQLVGDRHGKFALIDMTYWLLLEAENLRQLIRVIEKNKDFDFDAALKALKENKHGLQTYLRE